MLILSTNVRRVSLLLGFAAAAFALRAQPADRESNGWPFSVRYRDSPDSPEAWTAGGPFLFRKPAADVEGNTISGFRPFWVQVSNDKGQFRAGYFLYPLLSYASDATTYKWSFFEIVRRWDRHAGAPAPTSSFEQPREFEIFPFWFSRDAVDPTMNYRALFPIYGTVKNKLTFERLSWALFPLFVQNERHGAVMTGTPWPFIRVTRGTAQGWAFWPFYGKVERPQVSRDEFYLWPLGFNSTRFPESDAAPGTEPRRDRGFLPFYTRSTGPGFINEDYLWPFFGYSKKTSPKRYSEQRYLWPLFMQARGDDRYVNRWAPFYSHSVNRGYDKQWIMWPMLRYAEWTDDRTTRARTQLLYFLYWNEEQRTAGRAHSPVASLTHLWPFFSHWDNGSGHLQWQALSPLEVFFPGNEKVRQIWTPFFALVRHERRASGDSRTSLLWNAVTWEKRPADQQSEFHLGPILGVTRNAQTKRISIGRGLFGFERGPDGWRTFWLDFPAKSATTSTAAR